MLIYYSWPLSFLEEADKIFLILCYKLLSLTFTATRGSNGPKSFLKHLALLYYRYLNTKTSFYSSTNHFPFITYSYKSWNNDIWFLKIFIRNPNFLGSEILSWV